MHGFERAANLHKSQNQTLYKIAMVDVGFPEAKFMALHTWLLSILRAPIKMYLSDVIFFRYI